MDSPGTSAASEHSYITALQETQDDVGRLVQQNSANNISDEMLSSSCIGDHQPLEDGVLSLPTVDHCQVPVSGSHSTDQHSLPVVDENLTDLAILSGENEKGDVIEDSSVIVDLPGIHHGRNQGNLDASPAYDTGELSPLQLQQPVSQCGQVDAPLSQESSVPKAPSSIDEAIDVVVMHQPSSDSPPTETTPLQDPSTEECASISEELLKCSECDLTFSSDVSLQEHQRTHREDSGFVCGICGKSLGSESLLSSHFATHSSGGRRYTCPDCGRIFRNVRSFQLHEEMHKVGRMFTCKQCGKAFRQQSILQKHRYSHMKKVRIEYACEQCAECFSTVTQLQQHERKVHSHKQKGIPGTAHECNECGKGFQKESRLTQHLQQHAVQGENFCKDCGREYASPAALQNHRCFRARKPSFSCKDCGRRFTNRQEYVDHERTHIDGEYSCKKCSESFVSRAELREHAAVHQSSPGFECKQCGKWFKRKGFLTNHEKTHVNQHGGANKIKSVQSDIISNHLDDDVEEGKSSLQHKSVFIKSEGVYRCQDCGKTFRQKAQTVYHQKKETNVRSFICSKCPNSYLTSAHLKAHMLIHSSSKVLKCDGCGRQFNYKSNLTSHLKKCPKLSGRAVTNRPERYGRQADLVTEKEAIKSCEDFGGSGDQEESEGDPQDSGNGQGLVQHQSFYNAELELYQCQDCNQTFKQKGQTLYHQRKVRNKRQFVCKICNKAFLTSPHLKAHELVHNAEKPLTCDGCGKGFNYKCNLKTHQRNGCLGLDPEGEPALSKMKLYKCMECGKEFKLRMYYEKHQKMHERKNRQQATEMETVTDLDETGQRKEHRSDYNEEEGTYKCQDCPLVFRQSGQALYHFRKYSNERKFVCKVCPKSFLTSAHLKSHIMSHTKEKPYKCWYCGKGFNHNSNRKYHQRTSCTERPSPGEKTADENRMENSRGRSDAKKPITCAVCNKQFMLTHSWKVHMRVHTREQPFLCEYCGKAFRCRSNLYVHRNSHTKERPYLCNYCGKNFAQLSHVRVHEAIHNTEKMHKCGICGKSFNQEFYLKRHKVMHTDDRPFVCFCGKSFKYRGSLVSHKATHSAKRPYSCHLCDKAFKQSCHLKVHILTHGELKPFKCDKCQKAFIRKNQLSRHQRSHSDERGYMCSLCGKDFKHSSSMKRHQERKHNKEQSNTTVTDAQAAFDSSPYVQAPTNVKKNGLQGGIKPKAQWPSVVDCGSVEQENEMHMTGQVDTRPPSGQLMDNRVISQMDSRLPGQPVDCRMTSQPLDYRVSPQLADPRMPPQAPVSSHLTHLSTGHSVYSEAQYIQGPEFASVHLPHIGTFDFRTNTTGSVDYTIL